MLHEINPTDTFTMSAAMLIMTMLIACAFAKSYSSVVRSLFASSAVILLLTLGLIVNNPSLLYVPISGIISIVLSFIVIVIIFGKDAFRYNSSVLIVFHGNPDLDALSSTNVSIDQVLTDAQNSGIRNISDIERATYLNGRITFKRKQGADVVEIDPVTKLVMHRFLRRSTSHKTLAILDMSGISTANLLHGIAAGDYLLFCVASIIKARLRDSDDVFRYTKDRFMIVMSATPAVCDMVMADIISKIRAMESPYLDGKERLSASFKSIDIRSESSISLIGAIERLENGDLS